MSSEAPVFASGGATRLARLVSMAPRVTPTFLRHQRLTMAADVDVGGEADVWFSSAVSTASPEGFEWHADAAAALRRALLGEGLTRYRAVWRATERAFVDADATARMEAELLMLEPLVDPRCVDVPAGDRAAAAARIEELLRVAVRALLQGGRSGLAYWAARLLPRLPPHVRERPEATMLDAGASLQLHAKLPASLNAGDELPEWLAEAAPDVLPRVAIAVERRGESLVFGHPDALPSAAELEVPQTSPLVLEVRAAFSERFERVQWDAPLAASTPLHVVHVGPEPAVLRTLLGEEYDLARVDEIEGVARGEVLDQAGYADVHREHFVGEGVIDVTRDLEPGMWFELIGAPGEGKTAQLVNVIDRLGQLSARGGDAQSDGEPASCVAWHLVRDDVPEWCDDARVAESLSAQIAVARPELGSPVTTRGIEGLLARCRRFASTRTDDERLVLVIDDAEKLGRLYRALRLRSSTEGITVVTARRFRDNDQRLVTPWKDVQHRLETKGRPWEAAWFASGKLGELKAEIDGCATWAEARFLRSLLETWDDAALDGPMRSLLWGTS